mmetsp:Transcript_32853/g.80591  ORF Transcript_32853/g.80591 Transcript_32853/m.80591 type:complete len:392 (+) Transcript_32853:122-1297(+)
MLHTVQIEILLNQPPPHLRVTQATWRGRSVDLLDVGPAGAAAPRGGTAHVGHPAAHASHVGSGTALVHLGHDGHGDALKLLLLGLVLLLLAVLVVLEPRDGAVDGLLERRPVALLDLVLDLLVAERVLERVGVVLESVLGVDLLALALVLLLEALGLLDHALDLVLREAALVVGDGDLVRLAGALVGGLHRHDAVGVEVEGHLDLGHAAGGGGEVGQLELAEKVAVLGHGALALEHLDQHSGLLVLRRREGLRLLGGDHRVAPDELGEHTAHSLDTEGERRHIEEQQVSRLLPPLPRQDAALDGGTVGHGLVGVDALVGLLAVEEVLEELLHLGDPRRPAHEHDLVHRPLGDLGVTQHAVDGIHGPAEEVSAQLLELGPRHVHVEVDAVEG